jgi:sec-independent protein translocase protein TatC
MGVALAYFILPKGLNLLLGFTPDRVINLVKVDVYLRFMIRMMLVFGIGFLLPVVVVVLNLIGILPSRTLRNTRNWTIIGIFVFAAVGTPSGDPISMLLVAMPMWGLYEIAVIICRFNDRRKRRAGDIDYDLLDDDEASDIGAPDQVEGPSDLDDPDAMDDPHGDRD